VLKAKSVTTLCFTASPSQHCNFGVTVAIR
jgi:hypothetical protein